MTKYKHIYIDLDRTIWDFDNNAKDTFRDIYKKYQLAKTCADFDVFYNAYVIPIEYMIFIILT